MFNPRLHFVICQYFQLAVDNIRTNHGDDSVSEDHVLAVYRNSLEAVSSSLNWIICKCSPFKKRVTHCQWCQRRTLPVQFSALLGVTTQGYILAYAAGLEGLFFLPLKHVVKIPVAAGWQIVLARLAWNLLTTLRTAKRQQTHIPFVLRRAVLLKTLHTHPLCAQACCSLGIIC